MVQLQITIDKNKVILNILQREDATTEEFEFAKNIQDLHLSIFKESGAEMKITYVEDLRKKAGEE